MILARKLPRVTSDTLSLLAANEKIVHLVRHGHGEHNAAGTLARVVYGTYDSMVVSESFKEVQSVTSFVNKNVLRYQELWSQNKKKEATEAAWSIYASDIAEEESAYDDKIHATDHAFQNNKQVGDEHSNDSRTETDASAESCEFNPGLEHYFDAKVLPSFPLPYSLFHVIIPHRELIPSLPISTPVNGTWYQTMQSFGRRSTPLYRNGTAIGGISDATNLTNGIVKFSLTDWKNSVGGM